MVTKIQKHLLTLKDEEYLKFHSSLCKTSKFEMIGIRVPKIREYAKQLLNENNVVFKDRYYEEILLKGFYIGFMKCDYNTKIKLIDEFVPLIDNWAVCDGFVSSLKFIKKNRKEYLNEVKQYLKSDKEYYQRYGMVVLLEYYVDKDYLEYIFKVLKTLKYNGYYSLMAGAWLLSYCFMFCFDETLDFVQNNKLNEFVYKKGIQKSLESFRVTDKQKDILRKLR